MTTKTIFAPATAAGRAGVAVIRISGKNARKAITTLCQPEQLPDARSASLRTVLDPASREILDRALILWFPAPNSFTGEDVVELHIHGGRAVMTAVIAALQKLPDFRLAEAGEFSRRAFENGKLDLTEAEAVADLVNAETAAQRRQALRQMAGELGKLTATWHDDLSRSLAYMEAAIDFADDELPPDLFERQNAHLRELHQKITNHLHDNRRGERLRDGFSIAILGAPNAGKSSLLNAIAQRDVAIVSSTAGTTRDVIEAHLDLGGYPVTLADTAGLRTTNDNIEEEGIRRALAKGGDADLKLLVFDASIWPQMDSPTQQLIDQNSLVVLNKCDLLTAAPALPDQLGLGRPILLSSKTGENLSALLQKLQDELTQRYAPSEQPSLTRARHRKALEETAEHINRALTAPQADMRAEDVRLAMRSLGRITGRVDVEDLLDIIFRDFCIGK